jgi:hypothetical protein
MGGDGLLTIAAVPSLHIGTYALPVVTYLSIPPRTGYLMQGCRPMRVAGLVADNVSPIAEVQKCAADTVVLLTQQSMTSGAVLPSIRSRSQVKDRGTGVGRRVR